MQWTQVEEGWCNSSIFDDVERFEEFCEKQEREEQVITSLEVVPLKYEIEETPVEDLRNKDTTNVEDKKPLIVEIDTDDENSEHNKSYLEDENLVQERSSSPPPKMANCVEYIQESCRVCLTNCFNGQSIFKFYKKKYLPNIILILTGIHVTRKDELPSMICFSCANLLLQAESIRSMCKSSDRFLKQQKEFKIEMERFDADDSQTKEPLKRSIEYASINVDKANKTNSPQKECLPVVKHLETKVFKDKRQLDDIEIKSLKPNEQILRDNDHFDEKVGEDHHHHDHNVESLEDDIDDQHCDEERLEDINEDQWSIRKNENEISKSSSESFSYNEDNDNDASEIFECGICSMQFDEKKLFDRHRRTHIVNKIKCPVCPKELMYRSMKLHLATHNEINEVACDQCGEVFNNVLILLKHIRQHKTNVKRNLTYVYRCDICGNENFTLSAYQTHMQNMHGLEDSKPFKCKQCSVGFSRKQAMYRHIDNVHNRDPANRVRDFLCNICGKNFYVKYHLEIHMRSHTGERPYKCKYCQKAFTQLSAMRTHEYIHTGEKPFACKQCGKKFKQYGHLTYHQQTHAEGFPYVCKICDHKFKIKSNLNIHMKLHSKKQFSCKICQKAYVWPCKLKEHIRKSHHGIELSELEDNLDLLEES